jgi:hypothetical protein
MTIPATTVTAFDEADPDPDTLVAVTVQAIACAMSAA